MLKIAFIVLAGILIVSVGSYKLGEAKKIEILERRIYELEQQIPKKKERDLRSELEERNAQIIDRYTRP